MLSACVVLAVAAAAAVVSAQPSANAGSILTQNITRGEGPLTIQIRLAAAFSDADGLIPTVAFNGGALPSWASWRMTPLELGTVTMSATPTAVAIAPAPSNYAYVASSGGIQAVSVVTPSAPVEFGPSNAISGVLDMSFSTTSSMYAARGTSGLGNLAVAAQSVTSDGNFNTDLNCRRVARFASTAACANGQAGNRGLSFVGFTDPAGQDFGQGDAGVGASPIHSSMVLGSYAYVVGGTSMAAFPWDTVSVTNPDLTAAGTWTAAGTPVHCEAGPTAAQPFLACAETNQLSIYDTSSLPPSVASVTTPCTRVVLNGRSAYCFSNGATQVIDISSLAAPTLVNTSSTQGATLTSFRAPFAYITRGSTFAVTDVSFMEITVDPPNTTDIGTNSIAITVSDGMNSATNTFNLNIFAAPAPSTTGTTFNPTTGSTTGTTTGTAGSTPPSSPAGSSTESGAATNVAFAALALILAALAL